MKKALLSFLLLTLLVMGCRDPYTPPVTSLPESFLVVEGSLNDGATTVIHLTKSSKLDQQTSVITVDNASVAIEGKDNSNYPLISTGNGNYESGPQPFDPNVEYRLSIRTVEGKTYASDYVKIKQTPPIDSVSWDRSSTGVQLYVNTKDPSNATRYYRWEYEETWEIHSFYFSDVIYENGSVRSRQLPAEDVSICWKYNNSSSIIRASSIRLSDDIISRQPIKLIAPADDRLSVRYSILVRQFGMDKGAYDFYDLMQRITEDIGSIFSPQPSEIRGNIHCITNPSEYVIGYFTASTVQEKRIFINTADVPQWDFHQDCVSQYVTNNPDTIQLFFGSGQLYPYYFHSPPGDYYAASSPECVDCRVRGGSTGKPSYW